MAIRIRDARRSARSKPPAGLEHSGPTARRAASSILPTPRNTAGNLIPRVAEPGAPQTDSLVDRHEAASLVSPLRCPADDPPMPPTRWKSSRRERRREGSACKELSSNKYHE